MSSMDVRFRPFPVWPGPPNTKRRAGTFRVDYKTLLKELNAELLQLQAKDITIATGHTAGDIKLDGWPRANARKPAHPGVILYLGQSKHGRLAFRCDTYTEWEDNLRGISLTISALRAVARYGATQNDEQFRGYMQIEGTGAGATTVKAIK